jgi:hypothetical protein
MRSRQLRMRIITGDGRRHDSLGVFQLEEERVVSEDWVVRYKNRLLQLERQSRHWAPAKSRVLVRENEAGQLRIRYREQRLPFFRSHCSFCTEKRGKRRCPFPRAPIRDATS